MNAIRSLACGILALALLSPTVHAQAPIADAALGGGSTRFPSLLNSASFNLGGRRIAVYVSARINTFDFIPVRVGNHPLVVDVAFGTFDGGALPAGLIASSIRLDSFRQTWRTGLQAYPTPNFLNSVGDARSNRIVAPLGFFATGGPFVPIGTIMQADVTIRVGKSTRFVRLPVRVSMPLVYTRGG